MQLLFSLFNPIRSPHLIFFFSKLLYSFVKSVSMKKQKKSVTPEKRKNWNFWKYEQLSGID